MNSHHKCCLSDLVLRIQIMSTKPLLEKKQATAKPSQTFASSAWAYFRLTRLHKFPAGSDLIFWPSGEYVFVRPLVHP